MTLLGCFVATLLAMTVTKKTRHSNFPFIDEGVDAEGRRGSRKKKKYAPMLMKTIIYAVI